MAVKDAAGFAHLAEQAKSALGTKKS
jgi:hypothetical protein